MDEFVSKTPSWDDYFMTMVYVVASKSKDNKTHLGAIIVGQKKEIVSVGYNGFPRGINDFAPERQERPEKYFWMEHAERNAIYNATLIGASLENCKMYTNGIPCMDCARAVIQSGIKEVIVDKKWNEDNSELWNEHSIRALKMFEEAGVKVRYWEGDYIELHKFKDGKREPLR